MLRRVDQYQVEVLLTLALTMGGYALAEALHFSAPIAIVIAGIVVGNFGRHSAMSEKSREHIDTFWELIDEILNAILFLLMGLELLTLPIERKWVLAGLLTVPTVLLVRLISVAGMIVPARRFTRQTPGAIPILTWGGLRGGLSLAMALSDRKSVV